MLQKMSSRGEMSKIYPSSYQMKVGLTSVEPI